MNRLVLAADNTAGSWPAPTYALGRYQLDNNGIPMRDKPLMTYLIVNICLDLGTSAVVDQGSILRPNAMIILALHTLSTISAVCFSFTKDCVVAATARGKRCREMPERFARSGTALVAFSMESIMMDLPARCFGYCAIERTRRRFLQTALAADPDRKSS